MKKNDTDPEIKRLKRLNRSMNKFLTMIAETIGTTVPKNSIEGINAADEMAQRIIALAKSEKSILKLRRLKVGERLQVGDYCFDARIIVERGKVTPSEPVRVMEIDQYSVISDGHHPHFRIFKSEV